MALTIVGQTRSCPSTSPHRSTFMGARGFRIFESKGATGASREAVSGRTSDAVTGTVPAHHQTRYHGVVGGARRQCALCMPVAPRARSICFAMSARQLGVLLAAFGMDDRARVLGRGPPLAHARLEERATLHALKCSHFLHFCGALTSLISLDLSWLQR
jgi:hypothetical protein